MKLVIFLILVLASINFGQSSSSPSDKPLKRDKKQTEFFRIENPEEHHGHPHHHHPDAHFPGNPYHHHHGTEQTDHTIPHTHDHTVTSYRTVAVVPPPKRVIVKTEHVDTSHRQVTQTEHVKHSPPVYRTVVHTNLNTAPIHLHHSVHDHLHPAPHKSPPGYPSSDYVSYYSKYTSRGGSPTEAAHSYYRDHAGHLYNYDVEPRFADPKYVAVAHVQGRVSSSLSAPFPAPFPALHDADVPSAQRDPLASARNYVAAGNSYHSRMNTGPVDSPSGKGPHHGYYFGSHPDGGKILVGNRVIKY